MLHCVQKNRKERKERCVLFKRTEKNVKSCVLFKRTEKNARTLRSFEKNACPTLRSFMFRKICHKNDKSRKKVPNKNIKERLLHSFK